MKRLIFLMLALLVAGSASAATKVQVMTDGVIDVDRLDTVEFSTAPPLDFNATSGVLSLSGGAGLDYVAEDPDYPENGDAWFNYTTKQLKVRDGLKFYFWNATGSTDHDPTVYLINEDFEGTGAPDGWVGYQTANFDYTASPISGSQSLATNGTYATYTFDEALSAGSVRFSAKFDIMDTASQINFFYLLDGTTEVYRAAFRKAGTSSLVIINGATQAYEPYSFVEDTVFYFWIDFDAGEKTMSIYISTTDTKPGTATETVTGNSASTTVNKLRIGYMKTGATGVYDNVKVSE